MGVLLGATQQSWVPPAPAVPKDPKPAAVAPPGCRLWVPVMAVTLGKKGNRKLSSNRQTGLAGVTVTAAPQRGATRARAVGGADRLPCRKPAFPLRNLNLGGEGGLKNSPNSGV